MKKSMKVMMPVAVTCILVLVFAAMIGSKVYATNMEEAERVQREVAESDYMNEVKAALVEEGFANSGVNMTKATNDAGDWEYTVIVYHSSVQWMEEADKKELEAFMENLGADALGKISFILLLC